MGALLMSQKIEQLVQHEIPGRVAISNGNGGLTQVIVTSKVSTAEIYLHGAHVAAFQKNGEPPMIFMSAKSHFVAGEAIRGGVPICFPWFGSRARRAVAWLRAHQRMGTGGNFRGKGRRGHGAIAPAE